MRNIAAVFSLPDKSQIRYQGEINTESFRHPQDKHTFSGSSSWLAPDFNIGIAGGPEYIKRALRSFADRIGASIEITEDNGDLLEFEEEEL